MNINDALDVPEWQRPQMFYGRMLTYHHGRHMYFWDGQHVPSVTTIIKRLDKPGLIQWAADMAVDHIKQHVHGPVLEMEWSELLSLIHISEPTRQAEISYAVFCLKKKKKT